MLTEYVADESNAMRQRLVELVTRLPGIHLTGQSGDALTAIDEIQKVTTEVAILDIQMPGGTGIGVLEHIRAVHQDLHVIILTAFPCLQFRDKCLRAGADYFFDTTCEFDQITDVLIKLQSEIESAQNQ